MSGALGQRFTSSVSKTFADLCEKYERYPLIVGNHLSIVGVILGYRLAPRQVVGVLHPAVAGHELDVCAAEVNRCPARDWVTYVLQRNQPQQNRVRRGSENSDHITATLRDDLHWLPVCQRIVYKICTIVYKCVHGTAPSYVTEMCTPVDASTGRRNLRSPAHSELLVPRTCLLYTSPSPRDGLLSRMPSSA